MEPMPQNNDQLLREIYRLTRENNELLHRARRSAFFWGFIKFILYALLIIAPIWFYITYLNGTVQTMLQDLNRIEGVNSQAQNQFQGFETAVQQLESRFGGSTTTAQ
jgi:hypothetical protein